MAVLAGLVSFSCRATSGPDDRARDTAASVPRPLGPGRGAVATARMAQRVAGGSGAVLAGPE